MADHLEEVSQAICDIHTAKSQLMPAVAKAVIESIRKEERTSELLQLIGAISGQGLQAEDLLIAIRNELNL
jgi:hypothetical protein